MQFMNIPRETETKWALFRHSFTLSREHDSSSVAVEIQFCMVLVCNSSLLSMVKWNTMPHTHENHVHHEQVGGQATITLLYSPHGPDNLSLFLALLENSPIGWHALISTPSILTRNILAQKFWHVYF